MLTRLRTFSQTCEAFGCKLLVLACLVWPRGPPCVQSQRIMDVLIYRRLLAKCMLRGGVQTGAPFCGVPRKQHETTTSMKPYKPRKTRVLLQSVVSFEFRKRAPPRLPSAERRLPSDSQEATPQPLRESCLGREMLLSEQNASPALQPTCRA